MPEGPPSFQKLWEQLEDEKPFPNESRKEFRRRIEKQINLLKRLGSDFSQQASRMDSYAAENLERQIFVSAKVGMERIRQNGEAEVTLRKKRSKRGKSDE